VLSRKEVLSQSLSSDSSPEPTEVGEKDDGIRRRTGLTGVLYRQKLAKSHKIQYTCTHLGRSSLLVAAATIGASPIVSAAVVVLYFGKRLNKLKSLGRFLPESHIVVPYDFGVFSRA
jgi:hypothetical protein